MMRDYGLEAQQCDDAWLRHCISSMDLQPDISKQTCCSLHCCCSDGCCSECGLSVAVSEPVIPSSSSWCCVVGSASSWTDEEWRWLCTWGDLVSGTGPTAEPTSCIGADRAGKSYNGEIIVMKMISCLHRVHVNSNDSLAMYLTIRIQSLHITAFLQYHYGTANANVV